MSLDLKKANDQMLLEALAQFCVCAGAPRCYQNWTPETLRDYLAFHSQQRTMVWLVQPSPLNPDLTDIVGTGVAWQCYEWDIRRAHEKREHIFRWLPTNPKGDAVFFADFICESPQALPQLLEQFAGRFPAWKDLKWFTYRHNKLIELTRRHVRAVLRTGK